MNRTTPRRVSGGRRLPSILAASVLLTSAWAWAVSAQSGVEAAAPVTRDPGPSPTLGAAPPALDGRTIVLFDGKAWAGWHQRDGAPSRWRVQDDDSVLVHGGDAITDLHFTDCQLHLEFLCPLMADREGQGRANSGVYLHGRYEVQVLDSFGIEPAGNTAGAVYSIAPALVNACRPPEKWQTYDIFFRAPRFDEAGVMTEPAHLTVLHNGILIHNHQPVDHPTTAAIAGDMPRRGPLMLQDHGNPVRYRNIWIRPTD